MIAKEDISIVIQGPLNPISIGNINNYKKYGSVIVSCWIDDDLTLLDGISDISIVTSALPIGEFSNPQNVMMQSITSLAGFQATKTPYCIKTRSDEYFSDLSPYLKALSVFGDKISCGNIFFRNLIIAHSCDHIYAGKTPVLIKALEKVISCLYEFENGGLKYSSVYPEVLLTAALLWAMDRPFVLGGARRKHNVHEKKHMMNNFNLIPVAACGKILIKLPYANRKHIYLDCEDKNLFQYGGGVCFASLDEL